MSKTTNAIARRQLAYLAKLCPARRWPLGWSAPEEITHEHTPASLPWMDQTVRRRRSAGARLDAELRTWLDKSARTQPDVLYAFQALVWCYALPLLAWLVSPPLKQRLVEHLLGAAGEGAKIKPNDNLLVHQLLAGELALTLAYLMPDVDPCRNLASAARRALSSGLARLLSAGGAPHAKHLALVRPLMACWTRCYAISIVIKRACWSRAAQRRYGCLVRHALRMTRRDGTQVFCDGWTGAWNAALFDVALCFGGDAQDRQIAALVLPSRKRRAGDRSGTPALPPAAFHWPQAATAVLRPRWSRQRERLTVLYPGQSVHLELECAGEILWSGAWELEVYWNDQPAVPASSWQEVCWVSDEDLDYLELEIRLTGGLRAQRQILLAREDRFLFLADAILGRRSGKLRYRGCLPLGRGATFQPAAESREGFLAGSKRRALVLPLALPEWRCNNRRGRLVQTARGLELCQSVEGRNLLAPLFLDLDPRRMTRPLTWRQLTVAQSRTAVPSDAAVGYRVMVGKKQWLLYRALASKANRSLLGHNLTSEMLVGRFTSSGKVEPLVEIE